MRNRGSQSTRYHIITNQLERMHKTDADDFDGYKWASHGSVFVGIYAYLMEHHGLWFLEESDFQDLEYLSEIELMEEGFSPIFGPDKHLRKSRILWNQWFCNVPARAKALIRDVKMQMDGLASEIGEGDFVEKYGNPSHHLMPNGEDEDIVDYLVERAHDPAHMLRHQGHCGWVCINQERMKSIVRANKGVKNVISEITDMCVGELFCMYEELMADEYLEWYLENEDN